jgi:hypothetical protein
LGDYMFENEQESSNHNIIETLQNNLSIITDKYLLGY